MTRPREKHPGLSQARVFLYPENHSQGEWFKKA